MANNPSMLVVITTVATQEDAHRIARELVERRLTACAQISPIESIYRWEDKVQHDAEWRLLIKTTQERYAELEAALKVLHPYELPAIYALPVTEASASYAGWVGLEVR